MRDSAGHPVARAEASVQGDSAIAVANDSGQFTLATTRPRNVLLHVRRLGYEPLDKEVDLGDSGSVVVKIVMATVPQSMATFRVVAKRTGVWGVVRTPWGAPIRDAQVEMLGGSFPVAKTDSAGAFNLPTQRSGSFLIVARKRGFAYAQTAVNFRSDEGEEAEIVLQPLSNENNEASGFGRMESVFRETSTRIAFKSSSATVISHDDLLRNGASSLGYALCGTRVLIRSPQRCPARASCVLINGEHVSALPLEAFDVSEVESVEFYPPRSDWSNTLAPRGCATGGNVAVVWLVR
ncbi:MAG TPA: hypothetical protein VH277_08125 [Gemmatimonadaceae bacterium]|nr:hypothetical protein [Gemmatimonadaceae bacterium]